MPHHLGWVHEALLRVLDQQTEKQVASYRVMELVEDHLLVSDVAEEHLPVLTVERRKPSQHLVQQDSEAPPIAGKAVVAIAVENLGRQVLGRADQALAGALLTGHVLLRESKIGQHCVALGVDQHVFWLQAVSKTNIVSIEVLLLKLESFNSVIANACSVLRHRQS